MDSGRSDAELVRQSLLGAKEPFAELVTRHRETAVSLAARVLGSAELARSRPGCTRHGHASRPGFPRSPTSRRDQQ